MMRSVFAGVSGLKNHQTRMDVIGNNISNVNTTGFKSSRVTFVDALSQTMSGAASPKANIGGTNPKQVGLGSSVGSIDLMFQDGSVQSTGKNTDLCISGNGLFVVKNGNEKYYTRDGAFEFDAEGNYVLPGSGLLVQGWMGKDGVVDTTTAVGNITVAAGKSMAAKSTSLVTYANNLNADIPMVVGISGGLNNKMLVVRTGDIGTGDPPTFDVTIGGKALSVTGVSGDFSLVKDGTTEPMTWKVKDDVTSGTSVVMVDEDGNEVTLTFAAPDPALSDTNKLAQGSSLQTKSDLVLKSNVDSSNPIKIPIGNKSYTVNSISDTIDMTKEWTVKEDVVGTKAAPKDTVVITDGTKDVTLKLNSETLITTTVTATTAATPKPGYIANPQTPATITLSDGSTVVQTNGTYSRGDSQPVTTTINVYDSLGAVHEIPIYFVREGSFSDGVVNSVDRWLVSLEPDSSVSKGQTTTFEFVEDNGTMTTVSLDVAEIQFTSSGKMVTNPVTDISPDTSKITTLKFTGGSIGTDDTEPGAPEFQSVNIDFTALTQFSGNNTVNGTTDGNSAGTLKEIQIDSSGVITGIYTNGIRQAEAQVAVAQFTNATGLTKTGNSLYQESNNSGQANVKTAADLGVTITPSALEMSNVDIANEFADMIVTQRGFQSNSKIVTVGDEMLETIINMKR
ncbi:MAG: flagellar hook-basal body complex protein [Selenomonadaceae bacterium]|nr:flagellar hook-basal body complex protein [Selenomonadaceae bacterium]